MILTLLLVCKVLKGHDDHVITCLQFSGSRIVSGSDDNTLKVRLSMKEVKSSTSHKNTELRNVFAYSFMNRVSINANIVKSDKKGSYFYKGLFLLKLFFYFSTQSF